MFAPPVLAGARDYEALRRSFRWRIPAHYNIGVDVCDRWAEREPQRLAVLDVRSDGVVEEISYGALRETSNRLANVLAARGIRRGLFFIHKSRNMKTKSLLLSAAVIAALAACGQKQEAPKAQPAPSVAPAPAPAAPAADAAKSDAPKADAPAVAPAAAPAAEAKKDDAKK